jgi:DeoR family suf operon transcriptional repressor
MSSDVRFALFYKPPIVLIHEWSTIALEKQGESEKVMSTYSQRDSFESACLKEGSEGHLGKSATEFSATEFSAADLSAAGPNSTGPNSTGGTISDTTIINYLRRFQAATVADLVEFTGVTATAVRQRLGRLMDQGWVVRQAHRMKSAGRGRPTYRYGLTQSGKRSSGSNYEDLASVLWSEIRAVESPKIRRGLLQKIVARLVENYRDHIDGSTLRERMNSLVTLLEKRDIPFVVDSKIAHGDLSQDRIDQAGTDSVGLDSQKGKAEQLPVLTALACPYPDLAEQDRMVCAFEKMLFSKVLGERLRLTACRLDGDTCCTFETRKGT